MQRIKQKCLARERLRWNLIAVFDYQRGFIRLTGPGLSQRGSPKAAKETPTAYREILFTQKVVIHGRRLCRSPFSEIFRVQLKKALRTRSNFEAYLALSRRLAQMTFRVPLAT